MIRFLPLLAFFTLYMAVPQPSQAQIFAPAPEQTTTVARFGFGDGNAALKTVLELQYQMQLLKRLIEHEQAVNNIVESALAIGMTQPAISTPDYTVCAQVPANLPCGHAYNDLYDGFSGLDNNPMLAAISNAPPILQNSDVPSLAAQALPEDFSTQTALVSFDTLFWTDITCMAMQCSAVISPDPNNPKARYRVVNGESLPDGSTIEAISATGVTLRRDGEKILLEPAPRV